MLFLAMSDSLASVIEQKPYVFVAPIIVSISNARAYHMLLKVVISLSF